MGRAHVCGPPGPPQSSGSNPIRPQMACVCVHDLRVDATRCVGSLYVEEERASGGKRRELDSDSATAR